MNHIDVAQKKYILKEKFGKWIENLEKYCVSKSLDTEVNLYRLPKELELGMMECYAAEKVVEELFSKPNEFQWNLAATALRKYKCSLRGTSILLAEKKD